MDYTGEVGVIINSNDKDQFIIPKGMKIAQMTISAVPETEFVEVDELSETERGTNGFGSTGTR